MVELKLLAPAIALEVLGRARADLVGRSQWDSQRASGAHALRAPQRPQPDAADGTRWDGGPAPVARPQPEAADGTRWDGGPAPAAARAPQDGADKTRWETRSPGSPTPAPSDATRWEGPGAPPPQAGARPASGQPE